MASRSRRKLAQKLNTPERLAIDGEGGEDAPADQMVYFDIVCEGTLAAPHGRELVWRFGAYTGAGESPPSEWVSVEANIPNQLRHGFKPDWKLGEDGIRWHVATCTRVDDDGDDSKGCPMVEPLPESFIIRELAKIWVPGARRTSRYVLKGLA